MVNNHVGEQLNPRIPLDGLTTEEPSAPNDGDLTGLAEHMFGNSTEPSNTGDGHDHEAAYYDYLDNVEHQRRRQVFAIRELWMGEPAWSDPAFQHKIEHTARLAYRAAGGDEERFEAGWHSETSLT